MAVANCCQALSDWAFLHHCPAPVDCHSPVQVADKSDTVAEDVVRNETFHPLTAEMPDDVDDAAENRGEVTWNEDSV